MTEVKSFDAVVLSVADEMFTKNNGRPYVRCTVQFKSGPLAGKTYFANRTLGVGSSGNENKPVSVGQNVRCLLNIVETDGVKRPFFEISTSMVDKTEDIMGLLGA